MQKPGLFGMNGFFVFLLTCLSVSARAQQAVGLILIDAEGKQPFTIRIGDQMYSSSVHGHLTLSHLKDSAYRLCLRFPKNNLAEQIFPVNVRKKDLGFILKGADSSWVLYNWQTKETIHPVYVLDSSRILEMGVKRDDGFSKLMASVVNDTSVMYNTYTGHGFDLKDSSVIGHRIFAIGQKPGAVSQASSAKPESGGQNQKPAAAVIPPAPTAGKQPSAKDSLNQSAANRQPPSGNTANPASVVVVAGTVKNPDKDSLITARRQQNHIRDSLQAVQKAAIKDSLRMVKMAKASSDSLKAVRKVFLRDSLSKARRFTRDSLMAVKARNDSLKKEAKNLSAVNHQPVVVPPAPDAGGESRLVPNNQTSAATDLPASASRPASKPAIPPKKIREVSLKISRKIVFLDIDSEGHTDTVTLFVYFESKDSELKKPALAKTQVAKKSKCFGYSPAKFILSKD